MVTDGVLIDFSKATFAEIVAWLSPMVTILLANLSKAIPALKDISTRYSAIFIAVVATIIIAVAQGLSGWQDFVFQAIEIIIESFGLYALLEKIPVIGPLILKILQDNVKRKAKGEETI